ncbi:MAG: hypothetical protein K2O16_04950 [Lachnospiraceae bacterium]|nr:hypothetical protein [Lachnospiraceae bacterium]
MHCHEHDKRGNLIQESLDGAAVRQYTYNAANCMREALWSFAEIVTGFVMGELSSAAFYGAPLNHVGKW